MIKKLGGIRRKIDLRDLKIKKLRKLGAVSAPTDIPDTYDTDISWLDPIWQGHTPTCGAHAGAHLKAILDKPDTGTNKYSPRMLWLVIKQSDGYPIEAGTDMRSIFKSLNDRGICDYSLLPNIFPTTDDQYSDQSVLSDAIYANAWDRKIGPYAFGEIDEKSIKQDILQFQCALVLSKVGDNWWGQSAVTIPTGHLDGHFFVIHGWDENSWHVLDSADNVFPKKKISINYPILESGTAVDIPDSVVKSQTQNTIISLLQKIIDLCQQLILKGRNSQ